MKLKVKNLGVIEEAEVDLSKDLIVLAGQNGTGKTYLAYTIYATFNKGYPPTYDNFYNKNKKEQLSLLKNAVEKNLDNHLYDIFATSKFFFKSAQFSVNFEEKEIENINFDLNSEPDYLSSFQPLFPRTYIAPSERNAINIFSKELSLIRDRALRSLLGINGKAQAFSDLLKGRVNRYSEPVRHSLDISEDLANLSKNISPFQYLANELETTLLQGKININKDGQVEFVPNSSQNTTLEIHLTASLVKSWANIVFYLRHLAKKNDCIIIDEPELNLHPDNQRLVARFLGRLVNEGFKVIISTHSDYIVKELSNLIMLSSATDNNSCLLKKFNYQKNQLLKPKQVEALLFTIENRTAQKIEVDRTGFAVKTIDRVIEQLDNETEAIYFELFEKTPQ